MNYQWGINDKKGYNNEMGRYRTKIELNFILKNLPKKKSLNILDAGGGCGRFAVPLIKKGHNIYIVDINKKAISLLPEIKNLRTKCIDFMKYESNERFNVILAIELIGYIPDLNKILVKFNRLLESKGLLILTATNRKSLRYKIRQLKKHTGYYNDMDLDDLKECIIKNGFVIEILEGFNWQPFKVNSNSKLVKFFAFIEEKLRLKYLLNQSPWLIFKIRKIKEIL